MDLWVGWGTVLISYTQRRRPSNGLCHHCFINFSIGSGNSIRTSRRISLVEIRLVFHRINISDKWIQDSKCVFLPLRSSWWNCHKRVIVCARSPSRPGQTRSVGTLLWQIFSVQQDLGAWINISVGSTSFKVLRQWLQQHHHRVQCAMTRRVWGLLQSQIKLKRFWLLIYVFKIISIVCRKFPVKLKTL